MNLQNKGQDGSLSRGFPPILGIESRLLSDKGLSLLVQQADSGQSERIHGCWYADKMLFSSEDTYESELGSAINELQGIMAGNTCPDNSNANRHISCISIFAATV